MGKSAILQRFADDNFTETFISTIGVDFKIKTIQLEDKIVKLQIWDTAGQERFQTITATYYRGAHGIFLVYSIINRESFDHISYWLSQIDNFSNKNCQKVIIGNKCDLNDKREVTQEELGKLGEKFDISVMETSAKDSVNVESAFVVMAKEMMNYSLEEQNAGNNSKNTVRLGAGNEIKFESNGNSKSGCQC